MTTPRAAHHPAPDEQLDGMIFRYLDGALDEPDRKTFAERLCGEPHIAKRLALLAADHAELRLLLKRTDLGGVDQRDTRPRGDNDAERFPARPSAMRPRRRWVYSGAFAVAAMLLVLVSVWSLRPALKLESGRVRVLDAGTSSPYEGARFCVTGDDPAVLRLLDGSRMELDVGSIVVVRGRVGDARQVVDLESGSGRFQVEKEPGVFRVETPLGKVTVLGTEFSVDLQPGPSGEESMRTSTALKLVVAVVVGSVQVDWSGGRVTLTAGQQKVFAAEGGDRGDEASAAKKESKDARSGKVAREGQKGDENRRTFEGLVKATSGQVESDGGRLVTRVTAVELVTADVTYTVRPDRNGIKLGQTFDGKNASVEGVLIQKDGRTLLVVTGIPALGGNREVKGEDGRVRKVGEGDLEGREGPIKVREGDREKKAEGVRVKKAGEGDRVRKAGEGDREGGERPAKVRDGEGGKEGDGARVKKGGEGDREGGQNEKVDANF